MNETFDYIFSLNGPAENIGAIPENPFNQNYSAVNSQSPNSGQIQSFLGYFRSF